jgi:hypothetical protein
LPVDRGKEVDFRERGKGRKFGGGKFGGKEFGGNESLSCSDSDWDRSCFFFDLRIVTVSGKIPRLFSSLLPIMNKPEENGFGRRYALGCIEGFDG